MCHTRKVPSSGISRNSLYLFFRSESWILYDIVIHIGWQVLTNCHVTVSSSSPGDLLLRSPIAEEPSVSWARLPLLLQIFMRQPIPELALELRMILGKMMMRMMGWRVKAKYISRRISSHHERTINSRASLSLYSLASWSIAYIVSLLHSQNYHREMIQCR